LIRPCLLEELILCVKEKGSALGSVHPSIFMYPYWDFSAVLKPWPVGPDSLIQAILYSYVRILRLRLSVNRLRSLQGKHHTPAATCISRRTLVNLVN
jgi:hypothetical protein